MFKITSRSLSVFVLFALIGTTWNPQPALPSGNTCNWIASASSLDYYWDDGDNWNCGGEPPSSEDDATISSSFAYAPIVRSSATAKTLTLSGVLRIEAGAGLTVGTWTNQGAATIQNQGTLSGNGEVKSGGTFHLLDSGTYIGNLTIDSLATASVGGVYMQGNVTNNGSLIGEDIDAHFHMRGLLFTNNGTVSVNEFFFEKGGGAVQEVNGSGTWDSGIDYLFVDNNTHLTALSNVTFGPQHFSIGTDGDLLDVGAFKATFINPVAVGDSGSIIGSPGGTVHTQGDGVSISIPNEAYFTPPLVVESGVTHAFGVFSGTITINSGGTLRVMAAPAGAITAASNVTVNGMLDGEDNSVNFNWLGQTLTVNGSVTVVGLNLEGASRQIITGTGSLSLHNLVVDTPGGASLNVPLSLDNWLSLSQNLYASDHAVVTLAQSATASENYDTDIFGVVKRTGPFITDTLYSFGNHNLTVAFAHVGSSLPTVVTMTVHQAPWKDLPGSINRSYTIQTGGGSGWTADLTLDYRDSELHGPADYLQAWTRPSASAPWARIPYTDWHFNQNWIAFQGLTHFSDWGLVIYSTYLPAVLR